MSYFIPKACPNFRGVRGVYIIWHGTNSDPELCYKGKIVNYWFVENDLWFRYKEECNERGIAVNEDDDDAFNAWVVKNAKMVKEFILDYAWAKDYCK